jgi:hypothetical protein
MRLLVKLFNQLAQWNERFGKDRFDETFAINIRGFTPSSLNTELTVQPNL